MTTKTKCRCFIHHPETDEQAREIFNNMIVAKDNDDAAGVFMFASQLLIPCELTGKSVQFVNGKGD